MRDRGPRFVDVALPLPLFQTFNYALEGGLENPVVVGSRVVVPLRSGKEIGVCVGVSDVSPLKRKPKAVLESPDAEPAVGSSLLELCKWMADYYIVPLGVVLRSVLPAALTGAEDPRPSRKTRRVVKLGTDIPSLLERDKAFARSKQQRTVFELIESLGGKTSVENLSAQLDFSPSVLKSLEKRGLIVIEEEEVERDPFSARGGISATRLEPTPAQQHAIDTMANAQKGDVFLLHGITGSGKTLVYIELLRRIVDERGQTAIVLVPEIALTPQTVDRFRAAFGNNIAVLHSALSEGERYDAWLALKRGEKRIVVGARSAVFAPLENLGAIIVDEEHESSYKQGETPRYHAREVAIVRAKNEGAITVLGSATPSLESWANASSGKYTLLTLPERVGGGRLPTVEVIDLRRTAVDYTAMAQGGVDYGNVIREPLHDAIVETISRGEQSILLLNRRGYSSFIQCIDCGAVATCPHCSITLTHHRNPERLICHYCLHKEDPRPDCPRCGGRNLKQRGLGTQQVERLLCERFPAARIARMDVDMGAHENPRSRFRRRNRYSAGNADDRQGTRFPQRHARWSRGCRRGHQPAGFQSVRTVLSASESGVRQSRARRQGWSRSHSNAIAEPPRSAVRGRARLHLLRARRDGGPHRSALSPKCAAREYRVQRPRRRFNGEARNSRRRMAARADRDTRRRRSDGGRASAVSNRADQESVALARTAQVRASGGAHAR